MYGNTHQAAFDMSRHVIIAFHGMTKGPVPIPLGRDYFVESRFHVDADIRIGVLIDREGRGRVLDKQMAQSDLHLLDIRTRGLDNVIRN